MTVSFLVDILLALSAWLVLACGRISLATAAFAAIGAVSTSAMIAHRWTGLEATVAGIAAAGAAGYVVGLTLARVDRARFAMATLVIGVAVPGSINIPAARQVSAHPTVAAVPMLVAVALCIAIVWLILRSRDGAAFAAVAQDERAAASAGMNAPALRCLAVTLAAAVAGFGGALTIVGRVSMNFASLAVAVDVRSVATAVIGGASSLAGPVIGAVVLDAAERFGGRLSAMPVIFDAALLLIVLLALPGGVVSLADPLRHRRGTAR